MRDAFEAGLSAAQSEANTLVALTAAAFLVALGGLLVVLIVRYRRGH